MLTSASDRRNIYNVRLRSVASVLRCVNVPVTKRPRKETTWRVSRGAWLASCDRYRSQTQTKGIKKQEKWKILKLIMTVCIHDVLHVGPLSLSLCPAAIQRHTEPRCFAPFCVPKCRICLWFGTVVGIEAHLHRHHDDTWQLSVLLLVEVQSVTGALDRRNLIEYVGWSLWYRHQGSRSLIHDIDGTQIDIGMDISEIRQQNCMEYTRTSYTPHYVCMCLTQNRASIATRDPTFLRLSVYKI